MKLLRSCVGFAFLLLSFIFLPACGSMGDQFAKSATPLAQNIAENMNRSINKMPEGAEKVAEQTRVSTFVTTVQAGDREAVKPLWFGVPGVRDSYVRFVSNDPLFANPGGVEVKSMLLRNAQTFDYLLVVGNPSTTSTTK